MKITTAAALMLLLQACWLPLVQAEETGPEAPCSTPAYYQFDFWLGRWTSYSKAGEKQGTNHLHRILGTCAIQENWTGKGGAYQGTSYNFYDKVTDRWYQTWVDNGGGHLFLAGGMVNGSMQLSGERMTHDGKNMIDRITWTPLEDGRVRQHWEVSSDGGDSWRDLFDGYYQQDLE
ncbi:MAG: hypothetical protein WD558_05510 [Pseudomonadales bacterium]